MGRGGGGAGQPARGGGSHARPSSRPQPAGRNASGPQQGGPLQQNGADSSLPPVTPARPTGRGAHHGRGGDHFRSQSHHNPQRGGGPRRYGQHRSDAGHQQHEQQRPSLRGGAKLSAHAAVQSLESGISDKTIGQQVCKMGGVGKRPSSGCSGLQSRTCPERPLRHDYSKLAPFLFADGYMVTSFLKPVALARASLCFLPVLWSCISQSLTKIFPNACPAVLAAQTAGAEPRIGGLHQHAPKLALHGRGAGGLLPVHTESAVEARRMCLLA